LFISREQAQKILDLIWENPIVGHAALKKYDHQNIGFCFGRAAYFHLELLRRNLHPSSIGKLFAIGELSFSGMRWDFHVATLARGPNQEWWVLDSDTGNQVEPIEIWIKKITKLDEDPSNPSVRFYFADAVKFHPLYGAYNPSNLYLPYFNHYFEDLARWFDEHPTQEAL
jgi:hypothetical protein